MIRIRNKKGQIAIWVILAMAIVLIVGLIFLRGKAILPQKESISPETFIRQCARQNAESILNEAFMHGGFVQPRVTISYYNQSIPYLCLNIGYFKTCINQHPQLINEIAEQLNDALKPEIEGCFQEMQSQLEKRNVKIELGSLSTDVELAPRRVLINIEREVIVRNGEETARFNSFPLEIQSPLYDLENVALEIANQEAEYCYFEYVGYMLLHPEVHIEKTAISEGSKIYTLTDSKTNKKIKFAVRSCAIPPGF